MLTHVDLNDGTGGMGAMGMMADFESHRFFMSLAAHHVVDRTADKATDHGY